MNLFLRMKRKSWNAVVVELQRKFSEGRIIRNLDQLTHQLYLPMNDRSSIFISND